MTEFVDSRSEAMRVNAFVVKLDHVSPSRAFVTAPTFQGEVAREGDEICAYLTRGGVRVPVKRLPKEPEAWVQGAEAIAEACGVARGQYAFAVNRAELDHGHKDMPIRCQSRTFAVAPVLCDYVMRLEREQPSAGDGRPLGYTTVWDRIVQAEVEQFWSGPLLITVDVVLAEWLWRLAREVFASTGDDDAADLMRCVSEAFPEADPSKWL